MKQSFKQWILLSVPFFISSCGSMKIPDVSIPMLNGEYRELSTVPKDAFLYQCEKNKKFYVKSLEGGKEMWLILPNREFGLKQVETLKNTYNNEITTLEINDPETYIKEGDVVTYQKCSIQKLK
jgi:membrane-bound inhibitor of C-type lysozyme